MAALSMHSAPVAFPTVQEMRRVDSGRGVVVHPALLYGEGFGSDMEGQHEQHDDEDDDADDDDEDMEDEARGEREDRVGLLGLPSSPRTSRVSLANTSSSSGHSGEARSRTHSALSGSSRSRHSSTQAHSRSRTHSSHSPSVRERANSLGASMRSLMQGASASLTQLDLVMRGATGPAAGLGGLISRPRSRVNSSMARLEEDVVFSPSATEMGERNRGVSGASSGSGSGEAVPPLAGRTYREEAEGYVSSGGYALAKRKRELQCGKLYLWASDTIHEARGGTTTRARRRRGRGGCYGEIDWDCWKGLAQWDCGGAYTFGDEIG